jgi:hypothetical protein
VSKGIRRLLAGSCLAMWLVTPGLVAGASTTPDAKSIIALAVERARTERKAVFVEFTGAACVWCRELEALLDGAPVGRFMGANCVVLKVWALDPDEDKQVPGAVKEMEALGGWGRRCGIPYYVILTADSQKAADGCGFPTTKEAADEFLEIITASAARVDPRQRAELSRSIALRVREVARRREGPFSWAYLRAWFRADLMLVLVVSVVLVAGGVPLVKGRRRRTRG